MKKALSIFFVWMILFQGILLAANEGASARLTTLINKIDEFETKQQEILAKQDKILEEIKSLKIQARR